MRTLPILAIASLIFATFTFSGSADGLAPWADAGESASAVPDAPFPLTGHVEGFASAPTVTWSGPAGCTIEDASALVTSATCATFGKKVFTFRADDGASSASDTVAIAIAGSSSELLVEGAGDTTVGVKGVGLPLPEPIPFVVPLGTKQLLASVTWEFAGDSYKIVLKHGTQTWSKVGSGSGVTYRLNDPPAGDWTVTVEPDVAYFNSWEVRVESVSSFSLALPAINAPGWAGEPGTVALLAARATGGAAPLSVAWEFDASSRRFDDATGLTASVPFDGATTVLARVTDANGFEVVESVDLVLPGALARPLTVVAVVDNGYSPYHFDFVGSQHPWNVDADPSNDIDFHQHPSAYIADYPAGSEPVIITLPTSGSTNVDALRSGDGSVWSGLEESSATEAYLHWIPGTKVIGALRFDGIDFQAGNGQHGTASASVAAGNIHGTCPECLFVLVAGGSAESLAWAASQPWIDVITNSYGHSTTLAARDNIYFNGPLAQTRAASEEGQIIVFSAGNGLANAFDVPAFTYWSSEKGPDWMITVGAVSSGDEQTYTGAGKPVDMSSIGESYPSSGGVTADGEGTHSGTSNAAPTSAGFFAKTLQKAREALADTSAGHAGGVVASGAPVTCGAAWAACPLGDGILTRRELQDLVFENILPTPQSLPPDPQTIPNEEHAYYYQGHGVVSGRLHGAAHYDAEWTQMANAAIGDAAPYARPAGEPNWFVVDSKCRQAIWGAWNGGFYTGTSPTLDPMSDPLAFSYDQWCSAVPAGIGATIGDTI